MEKRKKITVLMLHLRHGGIEKQTSLFVNELVKKYDVEIISTYSMKDKPAYEIDNRVKVQYLIDDKPNKKEFKEATKKFNVFKILKEGIKSVKILFLKKKLMINAIKNLNTDFVLSTRIEYAEMLAKYAPENVITMTQEHLHNDSKKYISRVKKSFGKLDYLIVLGPGSKANYSKWLAEANSKVKIIEIPNILANIPNVSSLLDSYTLISTGRMHPEKGYSDLLKVFKLVCDKIPNAKLNLVGGGDEYESLEKQATELGIRDNVYMPGMVSAEDVEKLTLISDIYVMTSFTECFPMVLLEASSCGLPMVAFNVPVGLESIIKNNENGYLLENRDIEEMANKIIGLFEDREKMEKMGQEAKKYAEKYLSENVMEKWYEIFDK